MDRPEAGSAALERHGPPASNVDLPDADHAERVRGQKRARRTLACPRFRSIVNVMKLVDRLASIPGWAAFMGIAVALTAVFLLVPPRSWMAAVVYIGLGFAEFLAVIFGFRRHQPRQNWSWRILGAGAGVYALANTIWYGWPVLLHRDLGFPSIADATFVPAYLLFIAGLALLVRARGGRGQGLGSLIDALIISASAGAFSWVYLIAPLATAPGVSGLARAVSLIYPLFDLALVVLLVRILLTRGPRPPAFWLLCGFVVTMLTADISYTVTLLNTSYYLGHPLIAGWLISFGFLGAAALHPSMASLSESAPMVADHHMSWLRLTFLAVAAVVFPLGQLIRGAGNTTEVLIGSTVIFALCIARMAVLIRELGRSAEALARRERELRSTVELLHLSEANLTHLAQHDVLTGLPNRALFDERLQSALAHPERITTVMLLDLDGFKTVNDSMGHAAGDALLATVARRLASALRPGDTVARLGGDEFTILAQGLDEPSAIRLADRVLRTLEEPDRHRRTTGRRPRQPRRRRRFIRARRTSASARSRRRHVRSETQGRPVLRAVQHRHARPGLGPPCPRMRPPLGRAWRGDHRPLSADRRPWQRPAVRV